MRWIGGQRKFFVPNLPHSNGMIFSFQYGADGSLYNNCLIFPSAISSARFRIVRSISNMVASFKAGRIKRREVKVGQKHWYLIYTAKRVDEADLYYFCVDGTKCLPNSFHNQNPNRAVVKQVPLLLKGHAKQCLHNSYGNLYVRHMNEKCRKLHCSVVGEHLLFANVFASNDTVLVCQFGKMRTEEWEELRFTLNKDDIAVKMFLNRVTA